MFSKSSKEHDPHMTRFASDSPVIVVYDASYDMRYSAKVVDGPPLRYAPDIARAKGSPPRRCTKQQVALSIDLYLVGNSPSHYPNSLGTQSHNDTNTGSKRTSVKPLVT